MLPSTMLPPTMLPPTKPPDCPLRYTSDLVLGRLTQRRLGSECPPFGAVATVPENAAPAELVVLIDEHTSSDGEVRAPAWPRSALDPD